MIVSPFPVSLALPVGGPPRSEGVHVSRLIRGIARETGVLDAKWADDLSLVEIPGEQEAWWDSLDEASRLRMSIGLAWEDWYVPQLEGVTYHPGEMFVDGVYMTHDGESLDTLVVEGTSTLCLVLHEVKVTYKSLKTVGDLSSQWMWVAQCKSYCKGLHCRLAYLHVLFLCGDYKYPISPQLRCWRLEFTQAEIDENWELMVSYLAHRRAMEREEAGLE